MIEDANPWMHTTLQDTLWSRRRLYIFIPPTIIAGCATSLALAANNLERSMVAAVQTSDEEQQANYC